MPQHCGHHRGEACSRPGGMDPSEWGAHFCFLYLLALVGTIAVRRTLGGLAGTQGHCASLLDFELEWRKAGALEEVGAIAEGLFLASATYTPPVGFSCNKLQLDGCFLCHQGLGWFFGEPSGQPRGDFPLLAQLRQGRQTDVIWKQKNKISGEGWTPEAHLGRKRSRAKGAWERQKDWEKGRSRGRSWHPLGESSGEKTAPRDRAAERRSLALAGEAGLNGRGHQRGDAHRGPAHDHSVQVRPHAAAHGRSAHRRGPSGLPPSPLLLPHPSLSPPGRSRPARAGGAGSAALEPAGAALALRSRRQCV